MFKLPNCCLVGKRLWNCIISAFILMTFTCCSEFSEDEEFTIRHGKLLREAIASEFEDYFTNYWNDTVSNEVDTYSEMYLKEFDSKHNWRSDYLSLLDNKSSYLEYTIDEFSGCYKQLIEYIPLSIRDIGIGETGLSIDSLVSLIDQEDNDWYYHDNGNALFEKMSSILGDPRRGGFRPKIKVIDQDWFGKRIPWHYPLYADFESAGSDTSEYCILKYIQYWINSHKEMSVTVDYCVALEESANSYVIGYSNQTAFQVTFIRNNDSGRFHYQRVEYDITYVGESLLD